MLQSNMKKEKVQEHNKETTKAYTLVRPQKFPQKSPIRKDHKNLQKKSPTKKRAESLLITRLIQFS